MQIQVDHFQPFASERKYTSATLHGIGTLYVGAFEFIFEKEDATYQMYHDTISQGELRTIALALAKENNQLLKLGSSCKNTVGIPTQIALIIVKCTGTNG